MRRHKNLDRAQREQDDLLYCRFSLSRHQNQNRKPFTE